MLDEHNSQAVYRWLQVQVHVHVYIHVYVYNDPIGCGPLYTSIIAIQCWAAIYGNRCWIWLFMDKCCCFVTMETMTLLYCGTTFLVCVC